MELDACALSRLQFALTVSFHYLFPPVTIGLALLMVWFEARFLRTGDRDYEVAARFWTRLFALNYALGVASGVVMEFQFGANWSAYSRFVGDVFGSPLAAEALMAFFLESVFLGILVFGWDRVSPRIHLLSTILVFVGALLSSVWIVVANSWQQTPAGHQVIGGRAEIVDFRAMVFNPSSLPRIVHVWLAAFLLGACFVLSISAYYLLKNRHVEWAKKNFRPALILAAASSLLLIFSGHWQAVNVAHHQPAKLAAFEGRFKTVPGGADLYLFGWPDEQREEVRAGLALPGMLSLLVHGAGDRPVRALDEFAPQDRPPVWLAFQTYHLMVGLGFGFVGLTMLALLLLPGGRLWRRRWLLRLFVFAVLGAYAANQMGWAAAEVGRQPWVVYGLLRTKEAFSPNVPAGQILTSLLTFAVLYAFLLAVFLFVLFKKVRTGPEFAKAGAG